MTNFHGLQDSEFVGAFDRLSGCVDVSARFPALPCRHVTGEVLAAEFDRVLSGRFSRVLRSLVETFEDSSVTFVCLDPDPEQYRRTFGRYPAFTWRSAALTETSYYEALDSPPRGNEIGALTVCARIFAIGGTSGSWIVWAERDWSIGVVCLKEAASFPSVDFPLLSASDAMSQFHRPKGWVPTVSSDDIATFIDNTQTRR